MALLPAKYSFFTPLIHTHTHTHTHTQSFPASVVTGPWGLRSRREALADAALSAYEISTCSVAAAHSHTHVYTRDYAQHIHGQIGRAHV